MFWTSSLTLWCLLFGAIESMGQGIRVESAYYGSRGGGGVDVAARVQRFADYGEPFRVSNDNFGIEPSPGSPKVLTVVYYLNSRQFSETVPEGEVFYFREYTQRGRDFYRSEIRIIRATYGAKGRYLDVTGEVRDRVGYRKAFPVSNGTFGVDPYPGKGKRLRIYYLRDGEQLEREYREGDWVRI